MGLVQQRQQPLDDLLAGVVPLDRPELRRPDREHPIRHARIIARSPDPHPADLVRVVASDPRSAAGLSLANLVDRVGRVLEVEDLVRTYGPVRALDGMTFAVRPGSVTGFLGPNGAGKTTTMRAIFGLTALDAGQVRWNDRPIDQDARRTFGYLPEERGLYPSMKVLDQLALPRPAARADEGRRRRRVDPLARRARAGRSGRRRAGGPLARQPAARPADQRPAPQARRARARRTVLRPRPGRRRCPVQGARRRGPPRRHRAVLVAPARPRRGPLRAGRGRRPRPASSPRGRSTTSPPAATRSSRSTSRATPTRRGRASSTVPSTSSATAAAGSG